MFSLVSLVLYAAILFSLKSSHEDVTLHEPIEMNTELSRDHSRSLSVQVNVHHSVGDTGSILSGKTSHAPGAKKPMSHSY